MFIVFDGIDGAGKTTHITKLKNWLKKNHHDYIAYREPGGTKIAQKIRNIFINNKMNPLIELFLLSAARRSLCEEISSKNTNIIILCDRFIESTYAYQGRFFSNDIIDYFVKLSCTIDEKLIQPDFTFLFLNSYGKNKNYMDQIAMKNKDKIITNFKNHAKILKEKYLIIPNGNIQNQQNLIRNVMIKLLQNSKKYE